MKSQAVCLKVSQKLRIITVLTIAQLACWLLLLQPAWSTQAETAVTPVTGLELFGKVLNSHGRGVSGVTIRVYLDGKVLGSSRGEKNDREREHLQTSSDGTYQVRSLLDKGLVSPESIIKVEFFKNSYSPESTIFTYQNLAVRGSSFTGRADITLQRTTGPAFWIATIVFVSAYILISFELLHRTMAAMLGASVMLMISYTFGTLNPEYHILTYESAIKAIDMNVILLLMGMMIIVGILKHTGVFQWCAYKCYQLARGKIMLLAFILMSFTGLASAFLDNVTTMLLLTPVTIEIAVSLGISPLALLIPEILASNIGGTATLIGDPPNIMIGSYAGLTFVQFAENLAPVCLAVMLVLFIYTKMVFGKEFNRAKVDNIQQFIDQLREQYQITDSTLLGAGLAVMSIVIFLFITHGIWHMEVSIAALFGASLLFTFGLLTKKVNMLEVIEKDIEWTTLLFFIFLFMLVGAVEEVGMLDVVADWVLYLAHGNLIISICLVLWVSAIMSAFVDNIPFTATMLPIVAYLTQVVPGAENGVLWWALAFGACFGGNGTMIGASANVVTLGISESAGFPVRFFTFMRVAFPFMVISVAIANLWLLLVYLQGVELIRGHEMKQIKIPALSRLLLPVKDADQFRNIVPLIELIFRVMEKELQKVELIHVIGGSFLSTHLNNIDFRAGRVLTSEVMKRLRTQRYEEFVDPTLMTVQGLLQKNGAELQADVRIEVGDPAKMISSICQEENFSTMILARKKGDEDSLFGGTALYGILHRFVTASVYIVGEDSFPPDTSPAARVVIGIDGSEACLRAAEEAAILLTRTSQAVEEVALVTVMDPACLVDEKGLDCQEASRIGSCYNEEAEKVLVNLGVPESKITGTVLFGRPGQMLTDFAESFGATMCYIGRRDRSKIAEVLLGSVCGDIIHRCRKTTIALVS